MSKLTCCDRCGEIFNPRDGLSSVKIKLYDKREALARIIRDTSCASDINIDVCPKCYEGFKAWFEMTYDMEDQNE